MFQLSFLNAGLLFFAAATVLPLLIWLLAKKKPRRIVFSSLRFIKLSQQQEKSRTKITNIILLIIRMLIILLVALAIARPMLASSRLKKSGKHPPTAIAIVLDTSYSMDYVEDRQSRLDKAKEAIKRINRRATDDDRLLLVTRDNDWNQLHSQIYPATLPLETLNSIQLSYLPQSWEDTFAFAESRLRESQMSNREIYLISDLMNEEILVSSEFPIAALPVSESENRQNLSLADAHVLPQLVTRGKLQEVEFSVTNHGTEARTEVLIQAVVNDIKVGERFISIPARESVKETITFELREEGWQSGYIEVLDEYLTADNRSYFAFEFYQKPRVAVVGTQALPPHLNSILRVFGGAEPTRLDPQNLNLQTLDSYQIFVFQPFTTINPRLNELFREMDARGIGSIISPGENLTLDAKNWLQNRFSVQLKAYKREPLSIDFISPHHQATALIADKTLRFSQITGYWEASAGASTLISAAGRSMALSAPNSALWLWDMGRDSAFFADPAFAVYAYRQLSQLMNTSVPISELKVGDSIRGSEVILPNGKRIGLASPQYITMEPGIYTINPDSPRAARLAVNIDYADSDPKPGTLPRSIKMLPENFEDQLFMARLGRDLWKSLLIIALILVLVELTIIKYLEYKSAQ